jgi:hypothetical protein
MINSPAKRFDFLTRLGFRIAGWKPGRDRTVPWENLPNLPMSGMARQVINEFFGLKLGASGPGKDCARSCINFNPQDFKGREAELLQLSEKVGTLLYPLGQIDNGHADLLIDEAGRTYLWFDEDPELIAASFDCALYCLVSGRKSADIAANHIMRDDNSE